MSNIQKFENIKQLVAQTEVDFTELAKLHGAVNFKREASFALQAMEKNDFLMSTASANPNSLKRAIVNVAAIGLSLSPVLKTAYLVPRKGEVCLDISYQGLQQLAIDCGIVKAVRAEAVFEKDKFKLVGFGKEPKHEFNPFDKDRGQIIGFYCVAITKDNLFLVEHMTTDAVNAIRDRSDGYQAFISKKTKSTPWVSDYIEMGKKTIIKRAQKSWPKASNDDSRFAEALDVTNSADPVDFNQLPEPIETSAVDLTPLHEEIRTKLLDFEKTEVDFCKYQTTMCRREIKSVEEMTEKELKDAIAMMKNWKKPSKPVAPPKSAEQELNEKLGLTDENN